MKWTVRDVVGYSLVALGVIGGLLMLSLTVGSFPLDWEQALSGEENNPHRAVLLERLFRSILALSVGAILSLVGTLFRTDTEPTRRPFSVGRKRRSRLEPLAITLGGAWASPPCLHFPRRPCVHSGERSCSWLEWFASQPSGGHFRFTGFFAGVVLNGLGDCDGFEDLRRSHRGQDAVVVLVEP